VNNKQIKESKFDADNSFEFTNVLLRRGKNEIKAKAVDSSGKKSDFSKEIRIEYKNKSPDLAISSPSDQQNISGSRQIRIEGKTDTGVQITVNDYWAIVDGEGNFSYLLNLQDGENKIKVVATDEAGNQKMSEIRVIFHP
jgi:bacillopeptidase F